MSYTIRTYSPGQLITGMHFFILNKGMNSGRPSQSPHANSFIIETDSQEDLDRYYWLSYGLWITGKFKYYLVGSVIPFIRKHELQQLIDAADAAIHDKREMFMQAVQLLYDAQQNSQVLIARIKQLQHAKADILRHFLHV